MLLEHRLRLLGDLTDNDAALVDSTRYDSVRVEGVKRFQDRHGLDPDGVIGKGTVAALNVPISTGGSGSWSSPSSACAGSPTSNGERFIVVNIPTFHLWAWDSLGLEGAPSLDMNVIVGSNSLDTQTPVFVEQMRYVIFRALLERAAQHSSA